MHILLIALSGVALIGCFLAYTRAEAHADATHDYLSTAEKIALALRAERDRVTTLEREVDALRRELRKLSGKFYASLREDEPTVIDTVKNDNNEHVPVSLFCPNYGIAQKEGPQSKAAKCDCGYCSEMRARREAFRREQRRAGHLDPRWVRDHAADGVVDGD